MSDNLNRSTPDFSKYDSMSIGELEEILRADVQNPKQDNSDIDEILYVMEVLAKIRRQNGIAGKTVLEAYQDFQQHYLDQAEENMESVPKRKATIIPFRWIATIAASLVLIFTLATSANAFSFKEIWHAVARWAEETFSFSVGLEDSVPDKADTLLYGSIQEALAENKKDPDIAPTWIPEGYELVDIHIERNPMQESFVAIYSNGTSMLKITIQLYLADSPEQIEKDNELREVYSSNGTDYYLFSNYELGRIVWIVDAYECYVSGELTVDEMRKIVDSIAKG